MIKSFSQGQNSLAHEINMCGIIAGVGKLDFRSFLIEKLRKLDYRGYDSAGIAYFQQGHIEVRKVYGRVSSLDSILPKTIDSPCGIGHTRWATHGRPNAINAHPHLSYNRKVCLVHNGVIENFKSLQNQLKVRRYRFLSETDSEVIANLIDWYYARSGSMVEALREASEVLEGSYACALLNQDEPGRIYFLKKQSPLLLCLGQKATFLCSDPIAVQAETKKAFEVDDGSYGYIEADGFKAYCQGEETSLHEFVMPEGSDDISLGSYHYHMEKEIDQIPFALVNLKANYLQGKIPSFHPGLVRMIHRARQVVLLGCGTSYFACEAAAREFTRHGKAAYAFIASEWFDIKSPIGRDTFFILVSQSGETADLLRCQELLNRRGLPHLAVTNVKSSSLERKATFTCLLYADAEIAVAATKSFAAEVALLYLLANALRPASQLMDEIDQVIAVINDIFARKEELIPIAKQLLVPNGYFLGHGNGWIGAKEAALKAKEIGYIHIESLSCSEFKHGPIALLEKDFPVVLWASNASEVGFLRQSQEETKSRLGKAITILPRSQASPTDNFAFGEAPASLSVIPLAVIGDCLALLIALEKGLAIDKPRNLAKSVTV